MDKKLQVYEKIIENIGAVDVNNELALTTLAQNISSQTVANSPVNPMNLAKRLKHRLSDIRKEYRKALSNNVELTGVAEWLCDNYYILEREGRMVIGEIHKLPPLIGDRTNSNPAIWNLAQGLCVAGGGVIKSEILEKFLEQVQTKRNLESSELQSFPLMLRAALLDNAWYTCVSENKSTEKMANAITSLRFLTTFDFTEIIERQSKVEQILHQDPAEIFPKMEEKSRAMYRQRVAEIAKKRKMSEIDTAKMAISLANNGTDERTRHVGYYLLDKELEKDVKKSLGQLWIFLSFLIPLILSISFGFWVKNIWVTLLVFIPLWEVSRPILDYFALGWKRPSYLPRLELLDGVPQQAKTLVVVSTLLTSSDKCAAFVKKMEQFMNSNKYGEINFGILADLKDANSPEAPEDRAIIQATTKVIKKLNRTYGGGFYLFLRGRKYCETQDRYSGWERKRGALIELVRFIKGRETSIEVFEGDMESLTGTKYILTLDSDTGLLMNSAMEMTSVMMHPLNHAVVKDGKIDYGFGILATRMGVDLQSAGRTMFSRVMVGCGGVSSYDNTVGDIYQDLFGEGIFAGKGIIDVDAFYTVMDDALPENWILSHDIIEGCILRAGYISDIELIDGFPPRPKSWFDRMHRWVRGDWQNISWVFGKHKKQIRFNGKFKLFDNLRRSITPPIALLSIIVAAFLPTYLAFPIFISALLSVSSGDLWCAIVSIASKGPTMLSQKYHNRVMPLALAALARAGMQIVLLPKTAFVCCDAIIRAIWRQNVTKKNMLEWSTAAESEAKDANNAKSILRKFGWTTILGILLFLFSISVVMRISSVIWIVTPLLVWIWGRPQAIESDQINDNDKEKMRMWAAAIWHFFDDFAGAEDNYLPPDNFQESPVSAIAHRTSPTNIGLLLLSYLAARDLKLIDIDTLNERVDQTLLTIEKLDKWNGNLYNWYDTKTAKPLTPRYVSSVDSGNFLCSLVAFREGLKEYSFESIRIGEFCNRIDKLLDVADLSVFYNKRRKLMHIGYDIEQEKLGDAFYDLLMSEARMTSFYAIAKRQISKKHWGVLGHTLASQDGYTGPISWTGTMFEYFMPPLLLPVYDGSLISEALKFAIYCQKRRVKNHNIPWGISESGFYAFDAALNYQYKAHGVQKLGLKRGLDFDLVISPYSTFLALPFDRDSAIRNLERLENMGMVGKYGFYEAIDFTKPRTGGGTAIVKSYMAHHVGMSLVAICNTLNNNIMQERFMRDSAMSAAQELLQEKIQSGAVVFDDISIHEPPDKPGRGPVLKEEYDEITPVTPRAHLLSNGEWTLALTDSGSSISNWKGIDIIKRSTDLLRRPSGIFAIAQVTNQIFPLMQAPLYQNKFQHQAEFASDYAAFYAHCGAVDSCVRVAVHGRMPCEAREIRFKNLFQRKVKMKLLLYLEPTLAKEEDEAAHPAFSRLFLRSNYDPATRILSITRRTRGKDTPISLAIGIAEDDNFEFETSREDILKRPEGIFSIPRALSTPFKNKTGAIPDSAVALRFTFDIPAKSQKSITLLMCAGATKDEAAARLVEARKVGFLGVLRSATLEAKNLTALSLADEMETRMGSMILPQILFGAKDGAESEEATPRNTLGATALWGMGISGDLPIVLLEMNSPDEISRINHYIKMHRALRLKNIMFDLVIAAQEGGDYTCPITSATKDCSRRIGCEYLVGARAGIHIINIGVHGEQTLTLLRSTACHVAPPGMVRISPPASIYLPAEIKPVTPIPDNSQEGLQVLSGKFQNNSFIISHEQTTPPVPWCHILTNPVFGTLVSDLSLGYSWALNARENKITPWYNDPSSDNRGEMLLLKTDGQLFDLCMGAKTTYTPKYVLYESSILGMQIKVTVTVPEKWMAKQLTIEIENSEARELQVAYYTEPVLGVDRKNARHISFEMLENRMIIKNPWNTSFPGLSFIASNKNSFFCTDRAKFLSGDWISDTGISHPSPCAASIIGLSLPPKRKQKIIYILGWAKTKGAALYASTHLLHDDETQLEQKSVVPPIKIDTPDKALNEMINTWLPWQVASSRMMARTGFYQCGGAWGFRDQLQDACALIYQSPALVRSHILRSAAHQFREGDVMHWWHALPQANNGTRGVRTRCSDDMLWLPYTVCEYIEKTADTELLQKKIYYIDGPQLEPTEHERYFTPTRSDIKEPVYQHCVNAIENASKFGVHGLPLIGNGDWNDGFNLVGSEGKGESVWLALFLSLVLERFSPFCREFGEIERADRYEAQSKKLKELVDEKCWDGDWYVRAFYDDEEKIGSKTSDECKIDSLPQSFAAIVKLSNAERRNIALSSAMSQLVDDKIGVVKLFTPPFNHSRKNPGYIKSYPPGLRENGGQYTHAGIWLALGLLVEGRTDDGWKLLKLLNPATRTQDEERAKIYGLEPYAMAADIYTNPACEGRGGWSLYTGAAGWYYRTTIEYLLGIKKRGNKLYIAPQLPTEWQGFTAQVNFDNTTINIEVKRGQSSLSVDGEVKEYIELDGKEHRAVVTA